MPTPASIARQCLSPESTAALDDAVAVAKRRQHAQTTSLHVVFALLSSPLLRDALSRSRSCAYSPRLQFKALDLCFSVSLDRLPSSAPSDDGDPPISNSLMAAIKRSQANQRRHPDTFHFYQQQMSSSSSSSSSSSFSGVKVELQQLVLAILDDPVVSRVFGEAGFRSCDIKMAILRPPPPPILRFPRSARCPPLFLCNLPSWDGVGDDNCRRIGEIMLRKCNRNPMLVGVGAADAVKDFKNWRNNLPAELVSLKFVDFELEESLDCCWIRRRVEELKEEGTGVVVGVGDLKVLMELREELVDCLVEEVTKMLEVCNGRLWVMGWSATYETYMKFV